MRRRILVAILSITAIAIGLFGVPLALIAGRLVDHDATLLLERQAILATREVPSDYLTSGDPVELPMGVDGARLALYGPSGQVVTGGGPAAADHITVRALGNHAGDTESGGTRVVAVPVTADEQVIGAIRAEQSTAPSDRRTARMVALLVALAAGILAVGAIIAFVVAGRLAGPVRRLVAAAIRLGDGDFSITIPASRIPEIDDANRALMATAGRLDELLRRERAWSSDASHQLRTPLAGLRAAIETELEFPRPERTDVLVGALVDINRLESTITELLMLARSSSTFPATSALAPVFAELATTWHGRFAAVGRPLLVAEGHDLPPVAGNAAMLRHAIDVLLDNALVHGSGEVRVAHQSGDETVTISVSDEGPSWRRSDAAANADDPHGLGLPLATRLVEAMGGRLHVVRSSPRTRVDIVLARGSEPVPGKARAQGKQGG